MAACLRRELAISKAGGLLCFAGLHRNSGKSRPLVYDCAQTNKDPSQEKADVTKLLILLFCF